MNRLSLSQVQRAMLRADIGPGRVLFGFAYEAVARGYAGYVCRGESGAATYVRGTLASGEALHGLADVDVVVVLAPDPTGAARERVRRRCERAQSLAPTVAPLLFDYPLVFDECGLAEVAARSTLTYGLNNGHAAYSGPSYDIDKIRVLERPELYGPGRTWRLLSGPDRRPTEMPPALESRRIAVWLELQNWWRWAFDACVRPDRPKTAYLCVKLIAEAARCWLWLTRGEYVADRREALERGRVELPQAADAFERAAGLQAALRSLPGASLIDLLPWFVQLSGLLAAELASQVAPAGITDVRLMWPSDGELALPHGGLPAPGAAPDETWRRLMPLVDWRSLAMPHEPDETFMLVPGDPGDPRVVAAVARTLDRGPYPTLLGDGLMFHPTPTGGRGRLRAVQCEVTDPVSFALVRGQRVARFPNAKGFSIHDMARRAVAEHRAWLAAAEPERDITVLGRLITAARAGLLWESVAECDPELALTVDTTLELLAARAPGAAAVSASARETYHRFARSWNHAPEEAVLAALRAVVVGMPAYATQQPIPASS